MTKKAAAPTTKSASGHDHFALGTLATDFLDTAWRVAIPVIAGAAAGIFIDRQAETKPWMTLLGVLIGFALAGLLLKKQLSVIGQEDTK